MRPLNWTGVLAGIAIVVTTFSLANTLTAQNKAATATGRVAALDVVKVFNEYQRQKDLTEEMNELQQKLAEENRTRRQKIDTTQAELDRLDPDDPTYANRMRELLAMQIDYKNWVDLKQADMTREIGVWSVKIYREIQKAAEEVAKSQGYDLVLYRGQFEPNMSDPEQVKEQIRGLQVIWSSTAVDLSQAVMDKLNTDYRAQPRVKMMYVP